ncbi:uncharacterized protein LOC131606327 [Vicia villosa]|uniref:uncharacterized protein LOC131606327 n=1 Tax=Vicia villosa TaxID=3911 RepID=UPI00273C5E7D|nr:uncharacterized protein LOC131606327 [Vicia villosa]
MSHSEAVLLLQLFRYANQTSKSTNSGVTYDALGFLKAVRVALQNQMEKYDQFINVLRDFSSKRIYISQVKAKLKTLFKRHKYLILEFNSFMPKKHRITLSLEESDASRFVQALKHAIQYKRENNYDDFVKVMKDYRNQTIDLSCVSAKVKVMLKNHSDLILEFNTFMPSKYRIKTTGKKEDNGELCQLPWDVLDVICKTLDFDDLFSFSGVCKNWRTFHKSYFLSSQEPLLVRMNGYHSESYSFISIPNKKEYDLKMVSCFQLPKCIYVRVSSGYFIFAHENNSFLLFNPFTRKKLVIDATFRVNHMIFYRYEALLAFEKCSEEFVLVVLCLESSRLYVYQSRHNGWFTYSTLRPEEVVVDFVVSNNIIYVVTNNASIGILNLNSRNIKFLNLKNTPDKLLNRGPSEMSFKLVNCDEQLLVIDFRSWHSRRDVYKIDLSTMNYVKMETLGDIALFYVSFRNCRALSNPMRFGYRSNYVYEVNCFSQCAMYDWNDYRLNCYDCSVGELDFFDWCFRDLIGQGSVRDFNLFDWCFRHLNYQVDYSLVE